jgi:fimbrial chaperone protein
MKLGLPFLVLAMTLLAAAPAAAYQLQPISRVFAPSGSKSMQTFELVNDGSTRIALSISFQTLVRDDNYRETNRDAEDEFLAYPAQLILAPGARQTVRVTWLGTPNPARELAYRIVVVQVPIERLDRKAKPEVAPTGQMRITMSYRGTLFIRPAKAAPQVSLHAVKRESATALAITLANTGTAVALVKQCEIRVAAGGRELVLPAASLVSLHNTRVLAGDKRRYVIASPVALGVGPVTATGRCIYHP